METWKDERCLEIKGDLVEFLLARGGGETGEEELWDVLKVSEGVRGWKWGSRIDAVVNKAVETLVQRGGVVVSARTGATAGVAGVAVGRKKVAATTTTKDVKATGELTKPEVLVGLLGEFGSFPCRVASFHRSLGLSSSPVAPHVLI